MKVYNVYKPPGKTPLQALNTLRKKFKIKSSIALTYAGRLDPMAEGVLLVLAKADDVRKNNFLKLPKAYRAEILFGFSTDSFDILGMAKRNKSLAVKKDILIQELKQYVGTIRLALPVYSSPPVLGKPLHMWAREGLAGKINLPIRDMKINSVKYLGSKSYNSKDVLGKIVNKIKKVDGDFRQQKITKCWEKLLRGDNQKYVAVRFELDCESGTYVRSIANDLGKKIGCGATLFSLKRLAVGKYKIRDSIKIA